jgi:hypothetical protein
MTGCRSRDRCSEWLSTMTLVFTYTASKKFDCRWTMKLKCIPLCVCQYQGLYSIVVVVVDHVLGDECGKIIERSDLNLWRGINRGGIPHTLSEWRTRKAAAWGARQIVSQRITSGRPTFGRGYGRKVEQPLPINELQTTEEDVGENSQESGMADPSSSVNLQQASIGPEAWAPRTTGVQLTEDIRKQLMAKSMCFSCYKRGHRARDINECPNKGKRATRLPHEEELHA